MSKLTYISPAGEANRVGVSFKAGTRRVTAAGAQAGMQPATFAEPGQRE